MKNKVGRTSKDRPHKGTDSSSLKIELEKLYDEYGKSLYACALGITGCPGFAEDAVQEAFFRVFRLGMVPDNLKAYMFRSVRNIAIDQIRRKGRTFETFQEIEFKSDGPFEALESREFRERVAKSLMTISADERETIIQHLYGGLTFREIAEMRGGPVGTIASWYRRGIERLRSQMERSDGF